MNAPATLPLGQIPAGQRVRLTGILGGHQMVRRLLGLGLRVGSEVQVLHRRGRGVVVALNGNRVALGGGISDKLLAEPLEDGQE